METPMPRVLVEVEPQHVEAVLAFLADLQRGRGGAQKEAPLASAAEPLEGGWSRDDVTHIAATLPYAELGTLLDELAANPGQWVRKSDVETAYGLAPSAIRTQLGGFTKRYRHADRSGWFWDYRKYNGLFEYQMSVTVAQWWRNGRTAR